MKEKIIFLVFYFLILINGFNFNTLHVSAIVGETLPSEGCDSGHLTYIAIQCG